MTMLRTIAIVLSMLLAACAAKRDFGRDSDAATDQTFTTMGGRERSERTWVEREPGTGGWTTRKYSANPYKDREVTDRVYEDRDYTDRELGERKNYRDRDPRNPERLPED